MKAILNRISDNGVQTLGDLTLFNDKEEIVFTCKTLELPDKDNKQQVSCIPKGVYEVVKINQSPNIKYPHFDIKNVPNRSGVKIHKGNYHNQIQGCILLGINYIDINNDGQLDVTDSGKALDRLLTLTDKFTLQIL